jgi:hypothetical protein
MDDTAHTDHGTVLKPDQAAITWSPDDGFAFVMPLYPDDAEVPEPVIAMAALLSKLDDGDFVRRLIRDFKRQ